MRIAPEQYAVYLVTDEPSRYAGDFLGNIDAAIAGGVTLVQYRDTESCARVCYERCLRLRELLAKRKIPLVINNDAALARAVNAAGVHVGQNDLPPAAIRAIFGDALDIGFSVRDEAEARAVVPADVDALGIGPIFDARATKSDASDAIGLERLAAIVKSVPAKIATCAIGGITLENAPALYATGVGGLACVSAFSKSAVPADVARAFSSAYKINHQ